MLALMILKYLRVGIRKIAIRKIACRKLRDMVHLRHSIRRFTGALRLPVSWKLGPKAQRTSDLLSLRTGFWRAIAPYSGSSSVCRAGSWPALFLFDHSKICGLIVDKNRWLPTTPYYKFITK